MHDDPSPNVNYRYDKELIMRRRIDQSASSSRRHGGGRLNDRPSSERELRRFDEELYEGRPRKELVHDGQGIEYPGRNFIPTTSFRSVIPQSTEPYYLSFSINYFIIFTV